MSAFGIPLQVVGGLVPAEVGVQHDGQKQIVSVVDHDELSAGALGRRVIDQVFLRAVRPDVPFQRELARDDILDGDFLVPAVPAVSLVPARFRDLLRAAERAARLSDGLAGHLESFACWAAGTYICSMYCFTMRAAQNCGVTVRMHSLTMRSQACGTPCWSR